MMPAKPLNQFSGMPDVSAALSGWTVPITMKRITQIIVEGLVQDIFENISFEGVIQPLSPSKVALKPEGERTWNWLQIHSFKGPLNVTLTDLVEYNGVRYKVMAQNDYTLNSYVEYHVVQDFSDTDPPQSDILIDGDEVIIDDMDGAS